MTKSASEIQVGDTIKTSGRWTPVMAIGEAPEGAVAITTAFGTAWYTADRVLRVKA